jgi:hypothetical protein
MAEKTVTKSFRISESAFLALEEEAKKRNISVNTLVNQLFMCYANFDRYLERHGSIFVKAYAKALFELIDSNCCWRV